MQVIHIAALAYMLDLRVPSLRCVGSIKLVQVCQTRSTCRTCSNRIGVVPAPLTKGFPGLARCADNVQGSPKTVDLKSNSCLILQQESGYVPLALLLRISLLTNVRTELQNCSLRVAYNRATISKSEKVSRQANIQTSHFSIQHYGSTNSSARHWRWQRYVTFSLRNSRTGYSYPPNTFGLQVSERHWQPLISLIPTMSSLELFGTLRPLRQRSSKACPPEAGHAYCLSVSRTQTSPTQRRLLRLLKLLESIILISSSPTPPSPSALLPWRLLTQRPSRRVSTSTFCLASCCSRQ